MRYGGHPWTITGPSGVGIGPDISTGPPRTDRVQIKKSVDPCFLPKNIQNENLSKL